jgi:type I restriction enzyme S subunit
MDNCQLPKGYKNTEVGVIPEDWEVKSISEIVDVDTDNLTTSTNPDYVFKYISLEDVDFGILRNYSEQIFKFAPSRARRKVKKGDILISTVRPNLKSHLLITEEVQDWICSTGFSVLRSKNQTDNVFLFNHFFASIINRQIENLITGSNYPAINSKEVKSLQIPLPPTKAEQTAIATALSDADALINSLSTLIAKKRNIKQGAMQKLLKPKEGWEVKKLGDFLDYEQPTEYLVTDTEYNDNNQIPVLTAGKTFILGYTNEEHGIFKNLPVIIFDDFTTAIKYVDFPFKAKSSAMKMLLPKNEKVNLRFIFEIMLQIKYQVADHKRHWIGEYSKIEIKVLSTPEEQNEIATILSDMDAEIQALETKLEKYRKIKLGMMQNLLTGKIRLV